MRPLKSVREEFGRAVKRARSLRGWTLDQLAAAMSDGTSHTSPGKSFLSNIENGKREISSTTVGKLIKTLDLPDTWIDRFLEYSAAPDNEETQADREADRLIQLAKEDATAPDTPEALLLLLAEEMAGKGFTDPKTAYTALREALQAAADLRAQARLPAPALNQIQAVLRRVAELNDFGNLELADATLRAAIVEARGQVAEQTRGLVRLLDSAIAQATLQHRPIKVSQALIERTLLEKPDEPFKALLALQREWFVRGRDRGLALALEISAAIAKSCLDLARTREEYGEALNDLGTVLTALGERELGTTRLHEAVAAYSELLEERTRDLMPLEWATTQNNLGNALATLGERETGTERLEQAVAAYNEALKEWTRERVPLQWAAIQNNIANVLTILGEREVGTERLNQAVEAYSEALTEYTRDRVPLDWAMTHNDLGNALLCLGERENGTERLHQAMAAYTEALKERTRDRVPLYWAITQGNLANVNIAIFDKTGDPAPLAAAHRHVEAAREVYLQAEAAQYVAIADQQIAAISKRSAKLVGPQSDSHSTLNLTKPLTSKSNPLKT